MNTNTWGFYGRTEQLSDLQKIFSRNRWFFLQLTGRRRIGKTALIRESLEQADVEKTLYIQIPDSDAAGIVAACNGYLETFGMTQRVQDFRSLAKLVGNLAREGYVIALDEFQYFNRKKVFDFCSYLQAEVDELSADSANVAGGLIVSGSIHTEMTALLEDRTAPLYNRTTDVLELDHLEIGSILEILRCHADDDPRRLLFLWNLFEGVPKFYRDAFEQGVLCADRKEVLRRLFFSSSSPLRTEAENWFLKELRGRYDVVLQHVASHPGATNREIEDAVKLLDKQHQVAGYLKILSNRYGMIERRQPIFSKQSSRSGRYHIRDNFLRAWLAALKRPVSAVAFRPEDTLIDQADEQLSMIEGYALEDLVKRIYSERSRLDIGDFSLTHMPEGYWDRQDVEIDLVAINDSDQIIRFVTCKRNPEKLPGSCRKLKMDAKQFLSKHFKFNSYQVEYVAISTAISPAIAQQINSSGVIAESISTLIREL